MRFQAVGPLLNCLIAVQEQGSTLCSYCAVGFMMDSRRGCVAATQGSSALVGCKSHGFNASRNRVQCMIPYSGYARSANAGVEKSIALGCLESSGRVCTACDTFNGYFSVAIQNTGNVQCKLSGPQLVLSAQIVNTLGLLVTALIFGFFVN